ncbi:uncharacterized mitochondrial protein AtMg00810-like [Beta vulgaris subsp. vulgaris]|uniref:uncharacterized mitochondrial protein AtMg00810-like n=1 Tax=Beta vulgaris subsp. vulgaris TaxID=3555 RepID=UPI0009009BE3|nr:uncharacterized mitochondrial protein AtMg00810-like [Beta vulgaris subsp. vulgaris]
MKDLGPLMYFLGIEVARSASGIFLCQRKYTLDIISEAGILGSKPTTFSIEQNHRPALATGLFLDDPESYRCLVGRLIYLSVTRPNLAYSGILLRADCDVTLAGWCDSDWVACPLTRRSLSGWLVFLGASPIAWKTKKQATYTIY